MLDLRKSKRNTEDGYSQIMMNTISNTNNSSNLFNYQTISKKNKTNKKYFKREGVKLFPSSNQLTSYLENASTTKKSLFSVNKNPSKTITYTPINNNTVATLNSIDSGAENSDIYTSRELTHRNNENRGRLSVIY